MTIPKNVATFLPTPTFEVSDSSGTTVTVDNRLSPSAPPALLENASFPSSLSHQDILTFSNGVDIGYKEIELPDMDDAVMLSGLRVFGIEAIAQRTQAFHDILLRIGYASGQRFYRELQIFAEPLGCGNLLTVCRRQRFSREYAIRFID